MNLIDCHLIPSNMQNYFFVGKMTGNSFNPLSIILSQNKLTGPNYVDWKRNLDIVLTAEGFKYVLTFDSPGLPESEDAHDEMVAYEKWNKADEMARCYILASMSNVLQHQHQSYVTARDIMTNLKEMFGEQGRPARQQAMKALMSTKMSEGTPVREHLLKMFDSLNTLEVLGAEIDGESQVDIILESLPDSFSQFKLNYSMNKMSLSLGELVSSLKAAEGIIKAHPSAHNVEKPSTSKSKLKGKGKKKGKKQVTKAPKDKVAPSGNIKKTEGTPKGKCFHCGQKGHWKRNCTTYLEKAKSGMTESFVIEVSFIADTSNT